MKKFSSVAVLLAFMVVSSLFSDSLQQYWRNDNKLKQWPPMPVYGSNAFGGGSSGTIISANTNSGFGTIQSNLPSASNYGSIFANPPPNPYQQQQQQQSAGGSYAPPAAAAVYPSNSNGFGSIFGSSSSSQQQSANGGSQAAAYPSYGGSSYGASSSSNWNIPQVPLPSSAGSSYPSYPSNSNGFGGSASIDYAAAVQQQNSNYYGNQQPIYPSQQQQQQQQQSVLSIGGGSSSSSSSSGASAATGSGGDENLVNGIQFDCQSRPTGHWRDTRYCDVFHACVFGQQKKTYSCPYVGERSYYDEGLKRCEFVHKNPSGCQGGSYYQGGTNYNR